MIIDMHMRTAQQDIFLFMQDFALRAGEVALARQKDVQNKKKAVRGPILPRDARDAAAKTVVDEIIQELFLGELYRYFPGVRVNVEEDTPLTQLFPLHAPLTAHLDPIDGTLSYILQERRFTIGMAISDAKNLFTHSVIYAPALGRMYTASPKGCAVRNARGIVVQDYPSQKKPFVIHEKRLLSREGRRAFERLGFHIEKVSSAHLTIVDVACARAAAFLYGLSNPHDSLVPYAFARAKGVEPTDVQGIVLKQRSLQTFFEGNRLHFRRIPSICYFAPDLKERNEILRILKDPKNLHPRYRKMFLLA